MTYIKGNDWIVIANAFLFPLFFQGELIAKCPSPGMENSSDSVIITLEKIVSSNFFLHEDTTNNSGDEDSLLSDLAYEYRLVQLDEKTIINLDYNIFIKEYIQKYTRERRENVSTILSLSRLYFPIFEQTLEKYHLPPELKYLPVVESSLNPLACSNSGAIGLWQFLYSTGKYMGLEINSFVDERYDPRKSTEAACKYLSRLYDTFRDWHLVLAAYNSGPDIVKYAIKKAGGVKDYWSIREYLPEQTRNFIPAFIAANYIMSYAPEHQIFPYPQFVVNFYTDTLRIDKDIHFSSISGILDIPVCVIRFLNPVYEKNFIPGAKKPMSLILPAGRREFFLQNIALILKKEKALQDSIRVLEKNLLEEGMQKILCRVERGEIIQDIARKYDCGIMEIVDWNHLVFEKVHAGQELTVWAAKNKIKKRKNRS